MREEEAEAREALKAAEAAADAETTPPPAEAEDELLATLGEELGEGQLAGED